MTKLVRVVNADAAKIDIQVRAELLNDRGSWVFDGQPVQVLGPSQQCEVHIWAGKRLVIEEFEPMDMG